MPFRITTPPAAEPLHLDEVKAHSRIQHASEDTLVSRFLRAARMDLEEILGRALVTQTLTLALDAFPFSCGAYAAWAESESAILLPRSPAIAVSAVTYLDPDGVTQTLAASNYLLDTFMEPNRILPAYGVSWPSTRTQVNAVQITYTAGYATPFTVNTGSDVCTFLGRAPVANEVLRLRNSGGALPGGLSENIDYYAVNVSGLTCKLSLTSGGSAIDITSAGTGTHYAGEIPEAILDELKLWVGNAFENREAAVSHRPQILVSQNYRLRGAMQ